MKKEKITIRQYRAKRLDNGEWVTGYVVPVTSEGKTQMHIVSGQEHGILNGFPVDPETIGQDTGMTDCRGDKVFEGDIVRYRVTDERYKKNPRYEMLLIYYDAKNAKFEAKYKDGVAIFWKDLRSEIVEVVSNIHDRPEYLDLDWNAR